MSGRESDPKRPKLASVGSPEAVSHETLWAHLRSASPLIISVTVATFLLHHFGWLNPLETSSLDFLVRLREPVKPEFVWLVAITDDDYAERKLFNKKSPLDPVHLNRVIKAIADGNPRVIGVDVDTGDSKGVRPETGVPIVWGQRMTSTEDSHERKRLPVLGNEQPQPGANELGIFAIPADADNVVRRFKRKIPVGDGEFDSMPWAVTKAYCRAVLADASAAADHERCREILDSESRTKFRPPLVLAFSEPRHREVHFLSASDLLGIAATDGWKHNAPIKGKIVMLGGTFALSGDVSHETPLGPRAGVELISDAIETELQGPPTTPLSEVLMVFFELIGGYFLTAWHFFSKKWSSVILRILAVPVLALGSSLLAFWSLAYWANFIPVLAGVLLHELHEHFKNHRDLVREIDGLKRKARSRKPKG